LIEFRQQVNQERAVLIGIIDGKTRKREAQEHLDELAFLASTAGAHPAEQFQQRVNKPNPKTLVGQGKLEEIQAFMLENGIKLAIFDDELSPSQFKNIENLLDCKVLDRTNLILDIFSKRAKTAQAKTQVELAQYQYILPRLTRMWTHHSRQQGGIGTKGPGEKEIETDRRIIHKKIKQLEEKLEKIDKQNENQRKSRNHKARVALVGYTNSGKSTLLNKLSQADIKVEDQLFATLDTTVRQIVLDDIPFLVSDTVGFIRKLPHKLVESFKSTLDEAREADILVHVVDLSHAHFEHHMQVVHDTLHELGASNKPTLMVFNKTDKLTTDGAVNGQRQEELNHLKALEESWISKTNDHAVFLSATKDDNLTTFKRKLLNMVKAVYEANYPYDPHQIPS
jgi:GTP-binding protein HflX